MHTLSKPRRILAALALAVGLGGLVAVVAPAVTPTAAPAIVQTVTGAQPANAAASGTNYFCFHSPTGKYRIYSGENNNAGTRGQVYATDGSLMWTFNQNDPSYVGGKRVFYTAAAKVPSLYYSWSYTGGVGWYVNSVGGNYQNYGLCA